jgi:hypothetical protein
MCHAAEIFLNLHAIGVKAEFTTRIQRGIVECMEDRISADNLNDAEIKEVHLEELKRLIGLLSRYKGSLSGTSEAQVLELYELAIAKRFLTCPFFEKRIKGMNEFKSIQEKVFNRATRGPSECRTAGLPCTEYLDVKEFSRWIME